MNLCIIPSQFLLSKYNFILCRFFSSRLTADAIGTPMGARHIFHVGPDGSVQGDATFGGD